MIRIKKDVYFHQMRNTCLQAKDYSLLYIVIEHLFISWILIESNELTISTEYFIILLVFIKHIKRS